MIKESMNRLRRILKEKQPCHFSYHLIISSFHFNMKGTWTGKKITWNSKVILIYAQKSTLYINKQLCQTTEISSYPRKRFFQKTHKNLQ